MDIAGYLLFIPGTIGIILGAVWMLIEAFKTGLIWGLVFIFAFPPIGPLIWLITHWEDGKWPFLLFLAGVGAYAGGQIILGRPVMLGIPWLKWLPF